MVRDMYADLEKIEERGKRKKEKSRGLFSSFGKKDEPKPDAAAPVEEAPQPSPEKNAPEPVVEVQKPIPTPTPPKPVAEPAKPVVEKKVAEPNPEASVPAPAPTPKQVAEPEKQAEVQTQPVKAPAPAPEKTLPKPETQSSTDWKPLTGSKLKRAEEDLLAYKKWLNKGYKSGVMTKEQCTAMVRVKEVELGLRAPE